MSIASEITSMGNNLKADYEGLVNLGVDLTNVDKNIENIKSCLDSIYTNYPKVTGTDGTLVTLNPTNKGKLQITEKGNSTQYTTTGTQKIDTNETIAETTKNSVTYSLSNGIFHFNGNSSGTAFSFNLTNQVSLDSGDYTMAIEIISGSYTGTVGKYAYDANNSSNVIDGGYLQNVTNVTLNSSYNNIVLRFYVGGNAKFTNLYFRVILAKGTYTAETMPSYEPYTAGASPNPSYPQTIKSVTGNNNVVVQNKNLFLKGTKFTPNSLYWQNNFGELLNSVSQVSGNDKYYDLKANITYTFKINEYANISNWQFVYVTNNNDLGALVSKGVNVDDAKTFTPTNDIRVWFRLKPADTGVQTYCYAQLEEGSTATSYVEKASQTLPLNLGSIELNKIGTYQDYIYKSGDKWYKKENIEKLTLGNAVEIRRGTIFGVNSYYVAYNFNSENVSYADTQSYDFFCNKVSHSNGVATVYSGYHIAKNIAVIVDSSDTVTTVNNKLSDATLLLPKGTATDTEITDTTLISQLEAIDNMQSYNGTTIITSTYDSANSQMILGASALKGE